jgi:hypothetical protein
MNCDDDFKLSVFCVEKVNKEIPFFKGLHFFKQGRQKMYSLFLVEYVCLELVKNGDEKIMFEKN